MNQKITDAEKFRRECEGRTFSERQLDKFLLRSEREESLKQQKPSLDDIMKKKAMNSSTALFNKKTIDAEKKTGESQQIFTDSKLTNELQEKHKEMLEQEKLQKEKEQNQNNRSVQVKDGISKVLKHIYNKGKVAKAIEILHKLVIRQSQQISLEQSLDVLLVIIENRKSFVTKEQKNLVRQIYLAIVNENKDKEAKGDQKYYTNFMDVYYDQVKILKIYFEDFIDIETDDSFQFNNIVKRLWSTFDEIPEDKIQAKLQQDLQKSQENQESNVKDEIQQKIQEKKEQEKQESKEQKINSIRDRLNKKKQEELKKNQIQKVVLPVYDYEFSENLKNFINSLQYQLEVKVSLIVSLYKKLLDFYRFDWAKPIINQIYTDIQFNKKYIFEENVKSEIEDLGNQWMDYKNGDSVKQDKISQMNSKIVQAGVARNGFKDARSENIMMGNGISTWGNRQNGL